MGFSEVKRVEVVGAIGNFYAEGTTTTMYVNKPFNQNVNSINIANDSRSDSLQFSFDAATRAGNLLPGESVSVNTRNKNSVYIKGTVGGGDYRCWSW